MPAFVNEMLKENLNISDYNKNRTRDLLLGILFDFIGSLSFAIPLIGEFSDVVWAPVSGLLMAWMYKGAKGKIGGIFATVEELLPFTDFIPSFTLMWIYTYFIQKKTSRN